MLSHLIIPKEAELLGASPREVEIKGSGADVIVTLAADAQRKFALQAADTSHQRFSLGLENIRGSFDAVVLKVFIGALPNIKTRPHGLMAGSVALYGLRRASVPEPSGLGLTFILDITEVLTELYGPGSIHADEMRVSIIPHRPLPDSTCITVGRLSIFGSLPDG